MLMRKSDSQELRISLTVGARSGRDFRGGAKVGEPLLDGFLLQPLGLQLINLYSLVKDMDLGGRPAWRGLLQKAAHARQRHHDMLTPLLDQRDHLADFVSIEAAPAQQVKQQINVDREMVLQINAELSDAWTRIEHQRKAPQRRSIRHCSRPPARGANPILCEQARAILKYGYTPMLVNPINIDAVFVGARP